MKIPSDIDVNGMLSYIERLGRRGTYLQAYALYVMSMYGRNEKAWADSLAQQGDEIGVFGYGFLGCPTRQWVTRGRRRGSSRG